MFASLPLAGAAEVEVRLAATCNSHTNVRECSFTLVLNRGEFSKRHSSWWWRSPEFFVGVEYSHCRRVCCGSLCGMGNRRQ